MYSVCYMLDNQKKSRFLFENFIAIEKYANICRELPITLVQISGVLCLLLQCNTTCRIIWCNVNNGIEIRKT